jgi:hypothetical protein
VILLYPLLLVAAFFLMRHARDAGMAHAGPRWFAWWTLAGAIFMFSLLTGFSIGLFILPLAATCVIWVARRAPGIEALGFPAGAGAVLILVWVVGGFVLASLAVAGYALARRREATPG